MIDPARVLFTWPDRGLAYDCRGCGACCKGLGIGLDAAGGELERLTAAYPEVAAFARRRGPALTVFNPRDRCWFLDDGGLCRVEREHGRAAKPAACRLFPFNRVFRLGSWSVVDFNSVICPLTPGPGDAHADVLAEIDRVTDPAVVGTPLPAVNAEAEGRVLVERERALAAACFAAADRDPDAGGDAPAALDALLTAHGVADPAAARDGVAEAFAALTGAAWSAPGGPTWRAALTLTPSLRFNELYGPRPYASRTWLPSLLPGMWLTWLGFAALGARLAARPLAMQELTTIWSEQAPLLHVGARWREAPLLKPGPVELPGAGDPEGVVRRLAQACHDNRKARRSLGALVTPLLAPRPVADRVALLKLADPTLRAAFARGA